MAYTGAVVTGGRGRGVVVATGQDTQLGAIAGMIRAERRVATPLQERLDRFARLVGIAVGVAASVAFVSGVALGGTVREMFLTAVALAVAAIPEGLPIAVTVTLALGVHRMAGRNAIVRRLAAVETLGSTTVIGSDKTGTLTENRMTVQEVWAGGRVHRAWEGVPAGSPVGKALLAGVLANEAEAYLTAEGLHSIGDPTEVALLVAAMQAGIIPDEVREEYAPALKAAAIGVAMGRGGTDVARAASDMVLADDNFVSITNAVEQGRVTFNNVRKVTFFLLSCGAATIMAILAGLWLGWPLVMLPAQLLWLNLVTNGLQDVALAFEPGGKRVLARPPRPPREGILSRSLWWRTALVGLVMAAGTLAMFRWELDRTGDLSQAQTVALTTMVVFMALHVGNARTESRSALRVNPLANPFLLVATAAALGVHVAALYLPPTQWLLRVEPIDLQAWVRIVAVATTVLVAVELDKFLRRRCQRP
jgi:magnesium-transporting ATPase (P-type)